MSEMVPGSIRSQVITVAGQENLPPGELPGPCNSIVMIGA
jgi:hypothetical protein